MQQPNWFNEAILIYIAEKAKKSIKCTVETDLMRNGSVMHDTL